MKIQAYNLKAEIYRELGDNENSDKTFEDILSFDPENLLVRNNYAYYLSIREEKLRKAEELSKYTIEAEPENPTYLDTYGWVLFKLGKIEEAKNYIESAIRNGAYNNSEVLEHYAEIMIKMNKCQEALEAYKKIKEIDSTYNEVILKIKELEKDCK